jgi:hypothetical protein
MMSRAWLILLGLCTSVAADARAATVSGEVSLFTIAKSENRNLVQYAIRVDEHCMPVSTTPVYAYWRMLEQGPDRTAPLLARERRAYGLAGQEVVPPATAGVAGAARIVLNGVPGRPVLVETSRATDNTCRAVSTVIIGGGPAHLFDVYVRLKSPFGVDYILLQGWSLDGTHRVEEKVAP